MPPPLPTQIFLRQHGLAALCDHFAIKAARHERFSNLILLKYNQIFSPMSEPIVQECRGLIVDENRDWAVVSHPFDKFFNAGEPNAAPLDWNTACVMEKLDGSLMSLYFYDGAWQVASSGLPDARGALGTRADVTMAQVFWEIWADLELQMPPARVRWLVVRLRNDDTVESSRSAPRKIRKLFRLARAIQRAKKFGPPIYLSVGRSPRRFRSRIWRMCLRPPRKFPLRRVRDLWCATPIFGASKSNRQIMSRSIICATGFPSRVWSKSFAATKATSSSPIFPDLAPHLTDVRARYETLVAQIETDYAALFSIEAPRDFAAAAQTKFAPAALFALRNRKAASAREFLAQMNLAPLLKLLGLKEADEAQISD